MIANAKPDSTLDKKQILDPNGNELYEIRDEVMSVSHGKVGRQHLRVPQPQDEDEQ